MSILDWIFRPFGLLLGLCYYVCKDYGIALLLFTLITRILLFPIAVKQQKSSAEMARINPKIQNLQKKFGKDKQRLNDETMKLYQEEGYNPLGGCFPMIIQMGVLTVLYQVIVHPLKYIIGLTDGQIKQIIATMSLTKAQETRAELIAAGRLDSQQNINYLIQHFHLTFLNNVKPFGFRFFFINTKYFDLTQTPGWLSLNVYLLIPILCYATSFLSTLYTMHMNKAVTPQSAAGMNRSMLIMMPLVSTIFSFQFPAGLGVYWIYTNLFVILQTVILFKFYDPKRLAEESERQSEMRKAKRIQEERIKLDERKQRETEDKQISTDKKQQKRPASSIRPKPNSKNQIKKLNKQRLADARKREEDAADDTEDKDD